MPEQATEVTAAGIARLAGVGRAAVSNWRRRHADFPKPVGGTETSPSFALPEVEQWLRDQGKLAEVPLRERVWQQVAGHPEGAVTALIHTGCALLLVRDRPTAWLELTAVSDERMVAVLPHAMEEVLGARLGPPTPGPVHSDASDVHTSPGGPDSPGVHTTRAVPTPASDALLPSAPLLRAAAELAAGIGAGQTFEFLLGRQLDANPRQYTLTPPGLAELMAALAETGKDTDPPGGGRRPVRSVLDPAAGTGTLLRAVAGPAELLAQEADPSLAALTALRLALHGDGSPRSTPARTVRGGDALRADAFPQLAADTVLCHPPFNDRNWGHDELAYDPRWEYGFPARTESELAWVQHALARLRTGGTAVLLMPPAAASRRSGRRIRADLLRRGALRAVIALPAGAAPPYGIPLHLWVLRKPGGELRPVPELLLVDTTDPAEPGTTTGTQTGGGRDRPDWPAVHTAVLDAWRDRADLPGVSRVVPVIELLDDDVDLAPARHLPRPAAGGGAAGLEDVRERLADTLRRTADLTPPPAELSAPAHWPLTTVGELARAGALLLRTGTGTGPAPRTGPGTGPGTRTGTGTGPDTRTGPDTTSDTTPGAETAPVLTEHDVLAGTAPSGTPAPPPTGTGSPTPDDPVLLEPGDVVVPVLGGGSVARVVDEATAGAVLGRNLQLLRPDPAAIDPWFLAGFLRGTANHRQASSYASTAARLDARRLQLPRLPVAEQQRYGEQFRALAAFEDALRTAGRLGGQLVRGMYDGLTDGTVTPR
ncbi:N-6 DNA methylase [Streptomyces sp. NPDC012389]|uniref:N-6 DNA methylase n=1 Tax=Streptomyces sp. NPDC012389 TaxID=3364830 RepID=UPI0036E5ED27